jgi:hypothetical protein
VQSGLAEHAEVLAGRRQVRHRCLPDSSKLGDPHFASEIYNKFIPLPVMFTMEKIEQRIHDVEFYVTDIREFRDPYLGVTVPGSDTILVIERWDEPTFR